MTNDTSTLNGALMELGETLASNLEAKGVTASANDGLTTLANKVLDIQTGGSCYHIEFTEDNYVAISNVATVTIYLQENYAPKTNASVSITGGSSTVTATTDSNGIATANVTVSSATTLTATYSNVSDTASVTLRTYYINDDASADNSSTLFGDSIGLRNSGSNTTGWNSSGYYTVKTHSNGQKESFRVLSPLTGITGNMVIEWDGYSEQTSGTDGLVIYNASNAWEKLTDNVDTSKRFWYGYNDGSFHETALTGTEYTYQKWVHYKYTLQGTSFKMEVFINDTLVFSDTETIHFTRGSSTQYGFNSEWDANRTTRYKNIQAYSI